MALITREIWGRRFARMIALAGSGAAVLVPPTAEASFNAAPCRDFDCHFGMWGILLGVMGGIPVSVFIFLGLHLGFRHPQRSQGRQALLGGFIGVIAYEVAAAVGALMAVWPANPPGISRPFSLLVFVLVYLGFAMVSFLYARSRPRSLQGAA